MGVTAAQRCCPTCRGSTSNAKQVAKSSHTNTVRESPKISENPLISAEVCPKTFGYLT